MPERFTNRALRLRGDTVPVTVRLHKDVLAFVDAHAGGPIRNRADRLQELVNRWALETERAERAQTPH